MRAPGCFVTVSQRVVLHPSTLLECPYSVSSEEGTVDWVEHFARNRTECIYIPWELGVHVGPHLRSALAKSLQRFQIGESGDGEHLRKVAARTGHRQYALAVEAFVR